MATGYCVVLTVTDSADAAHGLARSVVEARLAACVQICGPVRSVYRWEDVLEDAAEWQLWCKTTDACYEPLAAHLVQHHSYDTPEIVRLPIESGHPPYLRWIDAETSPT
ncbi:MAG TPA: divalent-cation tolerance protein CutA [Cryptosporangiaceae bacterium]|nr:divalent-cation tolerance protein CutA [Cryptosporangiaceae bacterium]